MIRLVITYDVVGLQKWLDSLSQLERRELWELEKSFRASADIVTGWFDSDVMGDWLEERGKPREWWKWMVNVKAVEMSDAESAR